MLPWSITAAIGVHLLTILQDQGAGFAAAVALGTLVGPAQVGGRIVEMLVGIRFHPVWTMIASSALVSIGLVLLFGDPWVVAAVLIIYRAGQGMTDIVGGTLTPVLGGDVAWVRSRVIDGLIL